MMLKSDPSRSDSSRGEFSRGDSTTMSKEGKRKVIEETIARIEKEYGKGSIMIYGQKKTHVDISAISTGSFQIDRATGIGGLPRGRITEIFGPESSGKTTIALQVIAEAQRLGGIAAFIDVEHAIDMEYARSLGVNTDELLLSQPDFAEQALEIVDIIIRSCVVDIIVIDSVAALVPRDELEGNMGELNVGYQARLMSQALRKLIAIINRSKTCVVFINQTRQTIGGSPYSPKETTTGGVALKFYSSVRLKIRKTESLKDKEGHHYGNKVAVEVVKNKLDRPFVVAHTQIIFGHGISKRMELVDIALADEVIMQQGSWFYHNSEKLCQGREKLVELLKNDEKFFERISLQCFKDQSIEDHSIEDQSIKDQSANDQLIDQLISDQLIDQSMVDQMIRVQSLKDHTAGHSTPGHSTSGHAAPQSIKDHSIKVQRNRK